MRIVVNAGVAIAMVLVASFGPSARAYAADELVQFESAPLRVGQIQQRLARERGETSHVTSEFINGYLSKPEGNGPFPAVVYLHGCNGLSKWNRDRISELFSNWGYVALAVDSFATRGIKDACTSEIPKRQGDAWGALQYLSKLPFVDPRRVVVVGSSQGGEVSLQLASANSLKLFDVPDAFKFKAAVAFYPFCGVASDQLVIPTIILIGDLDDWTPARKCERWIGRSGSGAAVKLIVYPGAYHAFDIETLGDGKRIFGHWLKYDPETTRLSMSEMHDFLAAQFAE